MRVPGAPRLVMLPAYAISAVVNVLILVGLPFLFYVLFHALRHKRRFGEIARRAGLQVGDTRYLTYALVAGLAIVAALIVWRPALEPLTAEGSPQRAFVGLGWSGTAVTMALLYGIVKTGFPEELLFRGLIAGSLARRLSFFWANVWQASIFLLPHLLLLTIRPELWSALPVLLLVFGGALFAGWLRVRSESILGPWFVHAAANVTVCLSVAVRTAA